MKTVQKKMVKTCKRQYADEIEKQFVSNGLRHAWARVKMIVGANKKQLKIVTTDNLSYANELNTFY